MDIKNLWIYILIAVSGAFIAGGFIWRIMQNRTKMILTKAEEEREKLIKTTDVFFKAANISFDVLFENFNRFKIKDTLKKELPNIIDQLVEMQNALSPHSTQFVDLDKMIGLGYMTIGNNAKGALYLGKYLSAINIDETDPSFVAQYSVFGMALQNLDLFDPTIDIEEPIDIKSVLKESLKVLTGIVGYEGANEKLLLKVEKFNKQIRRIANLASIDDAYSGSLKGDIEVLQASFDDLLKEFQDFEIESGSTLFERTFGVVGELVNLREIGSLKSTQYSNLDKMISLGYMLIDKPGKAKLYKENYFRALELGNPSALPEARRGFSEIRDRHQIVEGGSRYALNRLSARTLYLSERMVSKKVAPLDRQDPSFKKRAYFYVYHGVFLRGMKKHDEALTELLAARKDNRPENGVINNRIIEDEISYNLACIYSQKMQKQPMKREIKALLKSESKDNWIEIIKTNLDNDFYNYRDDIKNMLLKVN